MATPEIMNDVQPHMAMHTIDARALVSSRSMAPMAQRKTLNLAEMSDAMLNWPPNSVTACLQERVWLLVDLLLAVSISGLFATIMTTFLYPLSAGGSAAAVWCWLISGAGCMCIAVSRIISSNG